LDKIKKAADGGAIAEASPKADEPAAVPTAKEDFVVLGPKTSDGAGVGVLRFREGQVETGVVRPMEHGKPIVGEVVSLKPRPELPVVCDVKVELDASPKAASRGGPPQVATDKYRRGWDAIYKRKKKTLAS
jgi:hypothetical protein